jgi:UDP-N-acetylmuramoyl-tripeptide--D-alanyl-D-alanine ligase
MTAALWTSDDAVRATGGRATRPWTAASVGIDSRQLASGGLFIALAGPNFDGHAFVADALAKGAAAAMVHRVPHGLGDDAPLIVVDDTFAALHALGRYARNRAGGRIIGVTGSVGKTGVKEALRLALGRQGKATANDGSLNNHWGLPLSLARLPADAAYGIFEMGMNHAGEIAPLTRLARPHVAVITTVEAVHIENFASIEGIADAKAEILLGVEPGGTAVLFRDNPYFPRLATAAGRAGIEQIVTFGAGPQADVRLIDASADAAGASVMASVMGRETAFRVGLPGRHWVINSLCVLAAAAAAGADIDSAALALADLQPAKGRGQRFTVTIGGGAFTLIDDSYNASPVSMAAAFEVLGRTEPGPGGRRIAVLGDMLELGDDELALHAGLAAPLALHRIDLVFTAGRRMAALAEALPAGRLAGHAGDSAAIAPLVAARVRPGDVVTVKGSAGSRMGRVVEALKGLAGHDETPADAMAAEPVAGG